MAVTIVGKSDPSDPVSCKPVTLPSAPTSLTAIPTDKQAVISFAEGFNGGSDIKNYEYSINSGSFIEFSPAKIAGPLVIGDLLNGTEYFIRLKAITDVGKSVPSSEVSVIPYTVPSTPVILSYLGRNRDIYIRIEQESNGGRAIINYEYSTDSGTHFRLFNPVITLIDNRYADLYITRFSIDGTTLLNNGTPYPIQIRAVNIAGHSPATTPISITPATVPDPPSNLELTVDDRTIRIAFTTGATGGSEIINYEYSTDGGTHFIEFSPVDRISPVFIRKQSTVGTPDLVNGTSYSVKLKAKNSIGSSIASTVTLFGTPRTIPSAPVITGILGYDKRINISFTQSSNGGSEIINYEYSTDDGVNFIEFNPVVKTSPADITITSSVGTPPLTNGITYNVRLRARNVAGRSTATASSSIKVQTGPSPPTITSITAGDRQLTINFTPGDNGGNSIISYSYNLDYPNNATGSGTYVANNSTNSFTFTGLVNGLSYGYKLAANTSYGQSAYTAFVYGIPARPGGNTVPSAPTNVQISFGPYTVNSNLTFYFTIGDNGGLPITYAMYKVWNSSQTEPVEFDTIPYTSGPITTSNKKPYDLFQINTWYVIIGLMNDIGESPWSAIASRRNS
jgi:titin